MTLGAKETSDELCHGALGPHKEFGGAGDPPEPRPGRARLPARGEDDASKAQTCHQVPTEEGEARRIIKIFKFSTTFFKTT